MKIKSIKRTEKYVEYVQEVQGHKAVDEVKVVCKEAPLEAFDEAMQGLKSVVAGTMNVTTNWLKAATITKLTVKYAKNGTRVCQVFFDRYYTVNEKNKSEKTPQFRIEDAESGRRQCSEKEAEYCLQMIHEAERYANEEREQFLLGLDDDPIEPPQPDDGSQLSFEEMEQSWKDKPVRVFKDSETPEYKEMPLSQCLYLIESESDADALRADMKANFDGEMSDAATIEQIKSKLSELVRGSK